MLWAREVIRNNIAVCSRSRYVGDAVSSLARAVSLAASVALETASQESVWGRLGHLRASEGNTSF
jgi:hypothetical protein